MYMLHDRRNTKVEGHARRVNALTAGTGVHIAEVSLESCAAEDEDATLC